MTLKRSAAYIGGLALLGAWLASAASTSTPRGGSIPSPPPPSGVRPDALAAEIQTRAQRLRERLAAAPSPQRPHRNPFVFAPREPIAAPRPVVRAAEPEVIALPVIPPEPELTLIGVAEDAGPQGPVRTAMISGPGDTLLMVKVGETVVARYRVTAIGADVVELQEVTAGTIRRISLK